MKTTYQMMPSTLVTSGALPEIQLRANMATAFFCADSTSSSSPKKRRRTTDTSSLDSGNDLNCAYPSQGTGYNKHSQIDPSISHTNDVSPRMMNIRCISESSSMQRFHQPTNAAIESQSCLKTMMKYYGNTITSKNSMYQPNQGTPSTSNIEKKRNRRPSSMPVISTPTIEACTIGSCSSSVPDFSRIEEAINTILVATNADVESQQTIADQLHNLATWTHSNSNHNVTLSCMGPTLSYSDATPRSTKSLTVHQVALSIISHNGLNVVLNVMEMHPHDVEIQEYGCTIMSNLLAILYSRRAATTSWCDESSVREAAYNDTTVNKGMTIMIQVIQSMVCHARNIRVQCAAIIALQEYFGSVYFFKPNHSMQEILEQALQNAQRLYLPQKTRTILSTISDYINRLK